MLKNALPAALLSPSEAQICPSLILLTQLELHLFENLCYGRTCLPPACVWTVVRSHASDAIVRHQPFKKYLYIKNVLFLAFEQVAVHLMLTPLWILVSQSETQKPDIHCCWHDLIVHSESTSTLYVTLVALGCSEGWYASYWKCGNLADKGVLLTYLIIDRCMMMLRLFFAARESWTKKTNKQRF